MAHYALLNENNIVIQVITGVDENIIQTDLDGTVVGGSTEAWEQFYATRPWLNATYCKRTSYNHNIRKQYAGIGFTYDVVNDIFIAPQPYPSWSLDSNFDWQSPTPKPTEGIWIWNEDILNWVELNY
jgi:hypothetical protein